MTYGHSSGIQPSGLMRAELSSDGLEAYGLQYPGLQPPGYVRGQSGADGSLVTVTAAAKPVYTQNQLINALTTLDGNQPSVAWGVNVITYSISTGTVPSTDPEYSSEMTGYVAMSAAKIAAAREAFVLWDELIAVDLLEMDSWPDAHITFNYSSATGGGSYTSYGYWLTENSPRSQYKMADADIWLATNWSTHDQDSDLTPGGYGIETFLHEIGHALGLSHPGNYNGSASFELDASHYQDTRQYSVMSYFEAYENGSGTDHYGTNGQSYGATPLLNDILAIQAVYGADMTTRTGGTTYGFNSTAGHAAFDFTQNPNPVIAIWDAGGIDMLDASGFSTDQVINLKDGTFSSIGALTNNVAIAYNAIIENAKGGSGNDVIHGNAVGNALYGNAGNDTLWGGAGADVLHGGGGRDAADYQGGTAGVEINLNSGTGKNGAAAGDTLIAIEDVLGTTLADTLIGNSADNSLRGFAGNDALIGGAGNDTLVGDAGADFLSGSFGSDTLQGGADNDVLRGGEDGDVIDGGAGYDWLLYNTATAAVVVNLNQNGGYAGEALGDVITNVENVIGTASADQLTGDGGRNYLLGGAGNDILDGGGDNDTLKGQGGNDTLYGAAGADVLIGGAGADEMHGGAGSDWASYVEATAGVVASLATGGTGGEAAGDSFEGIENIEGSMYADTLTGDSATNLVRGGLGNDTLAGGKGNDVLTGGGGADLFSFFDGDGVDRVTDFLIGTDHLLITGASNGFADLTLADYQGSAMVTYSTAGVIVLNGIGLGQVTDDMFLFA